LNIRQLSDTSMEVLSKVPGFDDKEVAERYKSKAQALVAEGAPFVNGVQTAVTVTVAGGGTSADMTAGASTDQKLKEMIQQSESQQKASEEGATE
jgi:hypothetical protein